MSSVAYLNNHEHLDLKLLSDRSYPHAKLHHMSYLLVHEFPQAALNFPIVFVKDESNGQFKPVAMFGFKPGENVFFGKPQWNTTYVPANIRRHPFLMMPKTQSNEAEKKTGSQDWSICIETESESLSRTEGERLFESDGKPSQQLENVKSFLVDFVEKDHLANAFAQQLAELNLFKETPLKVIEDDETQKQINGIYCVDEERLSELEDKDYLMLKKRGFIGPIYTHLTSLGQLERIKILRNLK